VRAKAHEFEVGIIRLAIDQDEIRLDMAIAVIASLTGELVIETPAGKRSIGGEQVHRFH
jgi:hypothetical protein